MHEAARLTIYNTEREKIIRQRMETYGFRAEHLKQGKTRLAHVKACTGEQDRCQQIQWELSQQIKEQTKAVQDRHARTSRGAVRLGLSEAYLLLESYVGGSSSSSSLKILSSNAQTRESRYS